MPMTPHRWNATSDYISDVFGDPDEQLRSLMPRAVGAGIPDIAVDAGVGRLLMVLLRTAGAKVAVEVGTLAGYSGIWLARGLGDGGKLYTIEAEAKHAEFARVEFATAGVADRVEIITGKGLDELPKLAERLGSASIDVLFLDAIKTEYPGYLADAMPMLRAGALVIADNALGSGSTWWIDDAPRSSEQRDTVDAFNKQLAQDPRFEAACVPIREGVMIARYVG